MCNILNVEHERISRSWGNRGTTRSMLSCLHRPLWSWTLGNDLSHSSTAQILVSSFCLGRGGQESSNDTTRGA